MELYLPREDKFISSYKHRFDIANYQDSLYETHWGIDMPSESNKTKRETFITVRALSVVGAEVMCGRATVVWEVIKHAQKAKPTEVSEGSFFISFQS